MSQSKRIRKYIGYAACTAVLLAAAIGLYWSNRPRLVLAPMIGGLNACLFSKEQLAHDSPNFGYTRLCLQDKTSASALIETTLRNISDKWLRFDHYELGYTLHVPLLKLFESTPTGFQINREAVQRVVASIENVNRPVVLYLFSDHFSVDSSFERALAKNPANLLMGNKGTLPVDKYYGENVYPWSFVNLDNEITRAREKAFHAVLDGVCSLPLITRRKVIGVTLLGELHHMFPDFQAGMGYSRDYVISDYSQHSVDGFRQFLLARFQTIENLNRALGSSYVNFTGIVPPQKNIRTERLNHYWEHIDAYAHGSLPISGWVAKKPGAPAGRDWVHIYDNGTFLSRVPAAFGRQDVLTAHPELLSADVGWQYNFNYVDAQPGLHTIDLFLETEGQPLQRLGSRKIAIMEKSQATPATLPAKKLPEAAPPKSDIVFQVDSPSDWSSYYYNPLVPLWHEFRKTQVTKYIEHFGSIAKSKCLPAKSIYSHQILPFVNPGWDETRFAVGRDLAVPASVQLGVSLYGEASYGTSFFDWFQSTRRPSYGITEFHPLKGMSSVELKKTFDQHYQNGTKFLSFFVESVDLDDDPTSVPNQFSFDRRNNNAGSSVLFKSTLEILK